MVINKTFFQGFFSPLLEDFAYKPGTFSPRWSGTLSIIYLSDFLGARCEFPYNIFGSPTFLGSTKFPSKSTVLFSKVRARAKLFRS